MSEGTILRRETASVFAASKIELDTAHHIMLTSGEALYHLIGHDGVSSTGVNLRGAPVVLREITITAPKDGTVEVSFDGHCYTSVGDRIALAASDGPYWQANDGVVSVEAYDSDLNHFPFSHTRVYEIAAGTHTFYAVGENYVEQGGDGYGSVYGSLTVIYTPKLYVGIEDPVGRTTHVSLHPNPVKDQFLIFENISGQEKDLRVDMSTFTGGTYFVRMKTARSSEVLPFVKL